MTQRAILRRPGSDLARCELTHLEREPIDVDRALEQHAAFEAALGSLGAAVRVLPPLAGHPDAPFVEDVALFAGSLALLTRPGAASRRGEVDALEGELATGFPLERIEAGTLDGGDVLSIGDVLFVGRSSRTNAEGIASLAECAARHRLRVVPVRVNEALHLKTAITWLGGDVVLANPDWVDLAPFAALRVLEVDSNEPFGGNVLRMGSAIVGSSAAPRTLDRVASQGFEVAAVDLSEFHRAEAGATCLALLLGDSDGSRIGSRDTLAPR